MGLDLFPDNEATFVGFKSYAEECGYTFYGLEHSGVDPISPFDVKGDWNLGSNWNLNNQDDVYQITETNYEAVLVNFIYYLGFSHVKTSCREVFSDLLDGSELNETAMQNFIRNG